MTSRNPGRGETTVNRQSLCAGKRVDGFEPRKPAEVAVSRNEFRNAVFEAKSRNVSVVNQITGRAGLANGLVQHGSVACCFGKQKERRGRQHSLQILQGDRERNRRMKNSGMSNHPEEFIEARPGNRPGERPFRQTPKQPERGLVPLARCNFGTNEDVRVNRLHALTPIHEIKQRAPVKQVDPGLFGRLPTSKAQLIAFLRARRQGAPKKVVGYRLEGPALFGSFPLQRQEKLIIKRQCGSFHMQKHIRRASRCQ